MSDKTTLQKSLLMIQKLKKHLEDEKNKLFDPIAVIGMSCRLPEAENIAQFWASLCNGKNSISAIPEERWNLLKNTDEIRQRDPDCSYYGGYLKNIDAFDAYFFGITPREALRMDPQQRILLELGFEAFEDAGIPLTQLSGSNTAVFSSLYASQFGHLQTLDSDMDALFLPTGSAVSIAANRFSYLFDLRGPSMVIDTACSSSLIAIQLACLYLQAGISDKALVSAININLLPSIHSVLAKASMLSPTGQCYTFDKQANGYVQGEGAGAIVLKPLSKALKDKDRVYAVIMGSAVNQDGKTNGLTAPNGLQQEELLRKAYRSAKVEPSELSYIECHGTGTFLGDPIEVQALGEVIGTKRDKDKPCYIASVKTNVGHLEPAAGIISFIKTALCLKEGLIPPHLHCTEPNPHIPFDKYAFKIPQSLEPMPCYGKARVAGISGFGFGGANAHLVLREVLADEIYTPHTESQNTDELFVLSAKDKNALYDLVHLWTTYLERAEQLSLSQICYNVHVKRSHFPYRLAIIAHSLDDVRAKLKAVLSTEKLDAPGIYSTQELKKSSSKKSVDECLSMRLTDLAQYYVENGTIDWFGYEKGRFYPLIDMPLYPWQHKKYWPDLGKNTDAAASNSYPLQAQVLSSPLTEHQFSFVLDTSTLPELADSYHVAHAGYYLEMLGFVVQHQSENKGFVVQHLAFSSPLVVVDKKPVLVHLILKRTEQGSFSFSFYSTQDKKNWVLHATGELVIDFKATDQNTKVYSNIEEKHLFSGDLESFYKRISEMGMPAGDTIRWTNRYWIYDNEILCAFRDSKKSDRCQSFRLQMHPGIIDACIQSLFLLLPDDLNYPYVASNMEQIEIYAPFQEEMQLYTILKEVQGEGKKLIGDWFLFDKHQNLIASCSNLCMVQLNNSRTIEKLMNVHADFKLDTCLGYEEKQAQLNQYLKQQLASLFSMPIEDISEHESLLDLGMDSLMAMALVRIIETNLGFQYSLPELMQGPSIQNIVDKVLSPQNQREVSQNTTETLWIANRKKQLEPKIRLFCFPFGGGGASIYREWQQEFSQDIEICPIQLPGRENRLDEKPIATMNELVAELAEQLLPFFDIPFAFLGHSFGSLIAFELTKYLRKHALPMPIHLFASAYPDPRIPSKSLNNLLSELDDMNIHLFDLDSGAIAGLDDAQLESLSIIFKDNGIVDYSDERMNKSIIQVLLPIFIADMNIVKTYQYHEEPSLDIPISVFLGKKDLWVAPEDHKGWAYHTSEQCTFHEFDRGHLFIRESDIRAEIIKKMNAELLKNLMSPRFRITLTD